MRPSSHATPIAKPSSTRPSQSSSTELHRSVRIEPSRIDVIAGTSSAGFRTNVAVARMPPEPAFAIALSDASSLASTLTAMT